MRLTRERNWVRLLIAQCTQQVLVFFIYFAFHFDIRMACETIFAALFPL